MSISKSHFYTGLNKAAAAQDSCANVFVLPKDFTLDLGIPGCFFILPSEEGKQINTSFVLLLTKTAIINICLNFTKF